MLVHFLTFFIHTTIKAYYRIEINIAIALIHHLFFI